MLWPKAPHPKQEFRKLVRLIPCCSDDFSVFGAGFIRWSPLPHICSHRESFGPPAACTRGPNAVYHMSNSCRVGTLMSVQLQSCQHQGDRGIQKPRTSVMTVSASSRMWHFWWHWQMSKKRARKHVKEGLGVVVRSRRGKESAKRTPQLWRICQSCTNPPSSKEISYPNMYASK